MTLPLSEMVEVLDWRRRPVKASERAARHGSVPYYGATGQVGWIDDTMFDEPLVLLGEDGAPFLDPSKPKAYLVDGPSWVNNHAHVLRPRSGTNPRFLKYFLDQFDYRPYVNGTTRLKLTQVAMKGIPVPDVSEMEQGRIVDILEDHLSRLDAANSYTGSARARIESLGAALAANAISAADRRISLGELKTKSGYGTSGRCTYDGGGAPVLRIPNVQGGRVDLSDMKFLEDESADVSALMVQPGDVLIVRTNGSRALIGRVAVVHEGVEAAFASYLIRYQVDRDIVLPEWVSLVLASPQGRAHLEAMAASSAGQFNLSVGKLDGFPVPVPELSEQRRLLQVLEPAVEDAARLRVALDAASTRSASLRRALLTAAFSGQLTGRSSDSDRIEELADASHDPR